MNIRPTHSRVLTLLHAILLVASALTTSHAGLRFDRYTIDTGLSQNTVIAVAQDKHGFLWIATQDGLNRWNGVQFTQFRSSKQPDSIASNYVRTLELDQQGRLWIGTIGAGLSYLKDDGSSFAHIQTDAFSAVSDIEQGPSGLLWLATRDSGLFSIDPVSLDIQQINLPSAFLNQANKRINEIEWDTEGRLWLGSQGAGLSVYNPDSGKTFPVRGLKSDVILSLFKDRSGSIWVGTYAEGIAHFQAGSTSPDSTDLEQLEGTTVYAINETDDGSIWIGTYEQGLFQFDRKSRVQNYRNQRSDPESISDDSVFAIYQDHSGQVWLGTDGGLSKFNQEALQFGHIGAQQVQDGGLVSTMVSSLEKHGEDQFWVGTLGGGVVLYDSIQNSFIQTLTDQTQPKLSNNMVTSLTSSADGLWVGTEQGLNFISDIRSGSAQNHSQLTGINDFSDDSVYEMRLTSQGDIWISSFLNGIYFKAKDDDEFTHFIHEPLNPGSISSNDVMKITETSDGSIWIGTNGAGLNRYQPETTRFDRVPLKPNDPTPLVVRCILEDSQGDIWVCANNEIIIIDRTSQTTQHLTVEEGLSSGSVNALLEDQQGHIWASTNYGLNRINKESLEIQPFYKNDGLQSNEFNGASLKLDDGRLVFGGINGINLFDPSQVNYDSAHARAALESLLILTREQGHNVEKIPEYDPQQALELSYRDYGFEVNLASLHFADPERNTIRYRLTGLDEDWFTKTGSTTVARFTNLKPGNYALQIMAGNNRSRWSEPKTVLNLLVVPPPWLRWWALLSYLVMILMSIYGFIRYRTHALRKRNLLLSSMVEERTEEIAQQRDVIQAQVEDLKALDIAKERFFENISHEFRTPLTLIIGPLQGALQSFKSGEMRQTLDSAVANAKRLLALINQLLEVSRLHSGTVHLNKHNHNLSAQLRGLIKQFEPAMRQKAIHCKLDLGTDLNAEYDAEAIQKVVTNLLSNANKFTPAGGTISVSLSAIEDYIQLVVSDTGCGISAGELRFIFDRFRQAEQNNNTQPGSGLGLALVRELVELHQGSVKVESTPGSGTQFLIHMPSGHNKGPVQPIPEQNQIEVRSIPEKIQQDETGLASGSVEGSHVLLLVDDEPDMRRYLSKIFSDYQLLLAPDGVEALKLAVDHVPDLILSDVMMPEMDGMGLLKAVRQDERISHVPIIFLTAKGGHDSKISALDFGIDDYIVKPFNEHELRARVRNLIDIRDTLAHRVGLSNGAGSPHMEIPETEKNFLQKLQQTLSRHFDDHEFTIADLASRLAMSERQLQRKLTGLLSQKPSDYLRNYRLDQAAKMLRAGQTVGQIYLECGFASQAHFARCFKAKYQVQPSKYRQSLS